MAIVASGRMRWCNTCIQYNTRVHTHYVCTGTVYAHCNFRYFNTRNTLSIPVSVIGRMRACYRTGTGTCRPVPPRVYYKYILINCTRTRVRYYSTMKKKWLYIVYTQCIEYCNINPGNTGTHSGHVYVYCNMAYCNTLEYVHVYVHACTYRYSSTSRYAIIILQ